MFDLPRPDVTNEGWNTWPTERVSHALVLDLRASSRIRAHATTALKKAPSDLAALNLAPVIREIVKDRLSSGEADQLRESLVVFALSRVDWLQLAQSQIEAAEENEVSSAALAATG
jgi:hypothetical protein